MYTFRIWIFWPGPSSPISVGSCTLVWFPSRSGPGVSSFRSLGTQLSTKAPASAHLPPWGWKRRPPSLFVEWQQLAQGSWRQLLSLVSEGQSVCQVHPRWGGEAGSSSWEQCSVNAEQTGHCGWAGPWRRPSKVRGSQADLTKEVLFPWATCPRDQTSHQVHRKLSHGRLPCCSQSRGT